MKKFKFTLQTVHKVRELKSERENLTLSELQSEAQRAAKRVANIEALRNDAVDKYTKRLRAGTHLNPVEMELSAKHFASLNAMQKDAQREADEKEQACLRQIDVVKAARVEVKVTDKLQSDQKRRHQIEADRQEQNNLDDLVSAKYARRVQQPK